MSFERKIAIVTGATSGIGHAATLAFARDGAGLVVVGRNEVALGELCRTLSATGTRAVPVTADVTVADAPELIVRTAGGRVWRHRCARQRRRDHQHRHG